MEQDPHAQAKCIAASCALSLFMTAFAQITYNEICVYIPQQPTPDGTTVLSIRT